MDPDLVQLLRDPEEGQHLGPLLAALAGTSLEAGERARARYLAWLGGRGGPRAEAVGLLLALEEDPIGPRADVQRARLDALLPTAGAGWWGVVSRARWILGCGRPDATTPRESAPDSPAARFVRSCGVAWEALSPGASPWVRTCPRCGRAVTWVTTVGEAQALALAGEPIAVSQHVAERAARDVARDVTGHPDVPERWARLIFPEAPAPGPATPAPLGPAPAPVPAAPAPPAPVSPLAPVAPAAAPPVEVIPPDAGRPAGRGPELAGVLAFVIGLGLALVFTGHVAAAVPALAPLALALPAPTDLPVAAAGLAVALVAAGLTLARPRLVGWRALSARPTAADLILATALWSATHALLGRGVARLAEGGNGVLYLVGAGFVGAVALRVGASHMLLAARGGLRVALANGLWRRRVVELRGPWRLRVREVGRGGAGRKGLGVALEVAHADGAVEVARYLGRGPCEAHGERLARATGWPLEGTVRGAP